MNKIYIMNEVAFVAFLKRKDLSKLEWYWASLWYRGELMYKVVITKGAL